MRATAGPIDPSAVSNTVASNSSAQSGAALPSERPQERLARWQSMFERIDPTQEPAKWELMTNLAEGKAPRLGMDVSTIFSRLIEHGDHKVCVELFEAHQKLGPRWDGRRELKLKLPSDWHCQSGAELKEVWRKLRLDILIVSTKEPHGVVSDDVCDCIVETVRHGLTELRIYDPVASPEKLYGAFAHSALKTVCLMAPGGLATQGREWNGYEVLTRGLARCHTLQRVDLNFTPKQFGALMPAFQEVAQAGLPSLSSVELSTFVGPDAIPQMKAFMALVRRIDTLTDFGLETGGLAVRSFEEAFLTPLSGHQGLANLKAYGVMDSPCVPRSLWVSPALTSLACPALKTVWWGGNSADSRAVVEVMQSISDQSGVRLDMPDTAASMRSKLEDPACPLQSLDFSGVPLAPDVSRALFKSLARNTSVTELILTHCYMDASTLEDLAKALKSNRTIENLALPTEMGYYYTVDDNHRIHAVDPQSPPFQRALADLAAWARDRNMPADPGAD